MDIKTILNTPYCEIAGMPGILYVRYDDDLLLDVTVENKRPEFDYLWTCNPISNNGFCELTATNQDFEDFELPGSALSPDYAQFKMTLSIMMNGNVLTTCLANVEKVPDIPMNLDPIEVISISDELDGSQQINF